MGKGDAKTRARRNRQKWAGAPQLVVPKPRRQPRKAGKFTKPQEDEALVALKARCRMVGADPESREDRDAARAVQHVDDVGRCLIFYHHSRKIGEVEKARLWTVWHGLAASHRTYLLRYLGQTGKAKVASLTMLPDPMQSDTGHTVDLRTAEEKDRQAKDRWARWEDHLLSLEPRERALLRSAMNETGRPLYERGEPTETGRATISSLRSLAKVVEKG